MLFLSHGSYRIRYELDGPEGGPAYVLVNGLTQYAELWRGYRDGLIAKDYRVLTFDLLGQGGSDKPSLFIDQHDQVAAIRRHTRPRRPARRRAGFSRRYQLRGPDRAAICDRAWRHAHRFGADEFVC
jgi:pimeloyl-ACP methyl ester carboxylesterase